MVEESQDLAAVVERLERRLEQERRARLESERIAERGLRELYARQQQMKLLESIAAAANQNGSVDQAMTLALTEVSKFVGWQLAHAFVRDEQVEPRLRSSGLWYEEQPGAYAEFRTLTEGLTPGIGHGLPGQALETARTAWMADAGAAPGFLRRVVADKAGLRAGFALPVMVGTEVAAVLEFFAAKPFEPQDETLRLMEQVGAILGRIIERARSASQLIRKNHQLTRMVTEAEAQRQAAETANRAKTDFLAVTSHEIRTPLNAVLGMAEALKRESLTPRQGELVDGVLDGGAMLLRLLNAVLDLAKIEAGKMIVRSEAVDLRALAERVARVWRPRAEEQAVRLDLDISHLPPDCVFLSDVGKIEQTLVNLLSNALKFSPSGGRVRLAVGALRRGDTWRVRGEVQDQGPGVPDADQARIFQPFEQASAGKRSGGTGLGLSICSGNVALLGGRMGMDTPTGGGARFWFEFRAVKTDPVEAPAAAEPQSTAGPGRALRILAAEDHPANRRVLEALLEPLGVELTLVNDGQAAVDAASARSFDIVLMDVNMPVMDGVIATQTLRGMSGAVAALPIYMLTANAFEDDVHRYVEAGADGVLTKPINTAELFAALSSVAAKLAEAEPETRRAG